ncbi:MAG TPA: diguanylate cyclase [Phycisphaerae bacterium]|jgi:diguanylate cyclase (GGDEF)-like protein|nr:diguanylate cyclase [Phycisphaerae bacterium]HOB76319.1 diguanylate cyclase [Phycisphaerae bacterium]HOJ55484.1 diguanylate cyclase [Phycisphaerae bacterium]HOL25993.1 diguanylate cyclase [Phycisphaerae bacterium]HPP22719.1 diguanylate cyclase [Phycisphaerae bacterium]
MNAPGNAVERFPLVAGLVTTVAGLVLFWGTSLTLIRLTGLILAALGVIMAVAEGVLALRRRNPAEVSAKESFPLPSSLATNESRHLLTEPRDAAPACADWVTFSTTQLVESFNSQFDRHAIGDTPWPLFDRWVREALNEFLRARRVRCFHVTDAAQRLVSLTNELEEPLWPPGQLPALVEHTLGSGRPYVHASRANGDLINRLAEEWTNTMLQATGVKRAVPHWLYPVREATHTIGLVLVGELPEPVREDPHGLAVLGGLLTTFWRYVRQADALALAERTDRTSGLLTRMDLTERARQLTTEANHESEPLVVLALAVEGIRRLEDGGHWALRDRLMRRIGEQMRRRLRSDDLLGRFSEDRFVAVLRRLDLALGQIIAGKLLTDVQRLVHEHPALEEAVRIRCGLSDTGTDHFEAAAGRAFEALRRARIEGCETPVAMPACPQSQMLVAGGVS